MPPDDRVEDDPEIAAMQAVTRAITGLDEAQTARVLRWAAERAGIALTQPGLRRAGPDGNGGHAPTEFPDLASLYDAVDPSSQSERALAVAYWFQELKGQSDVDAQQVNTELKQLGHGVENITSAFTDLMNRTPRLVIQTRKSGSSRQARKKYRVTTEGLRKVKAMLTAKGEGDSEQHAD
jgi:hypothetical protein